MAQAVGKELERYPGLIEPELLLVREFHPLGFAAVFETNSREVMGLAEEMWGGFAPRFTATPIRIRVEVTEDDGEDLPPEPVMRLRDGLIVSVADEGNTSLGDLRRGVTHVTISRATAKSAQWMRYYLVGAAPLLHIAGGYATPVHAGCVAWNGRGVLLCGESGDGKSTLSFACARTGWTYVTDDAGYIVHNRSDRLVIGNYLQVRFRPTAAEIFPEVRGREVTPRAAGKPSIEIPTASLPEITCGNGAQVSAIVFLNRREPGTHRVIAASRSRAREFIRRTTFGTSEAMVRHEEAIERILDDTEVVEMRYQDLHWAVNELKQVAG